MSRCSIAWEHNEAREDLLVACKNHGSFMYQYLTISLSENISSLPELYTSYLI